ncbi:hypothetical protein NEPAR06_1392 [Nematocida parisii]|nr:hypothetical protein NEPAR03_0694 [Nematocida parisii]KAI5126943.1 hypothetical protein NEPAR08_0693 [Nematocida parisii]KAI5141053.1 hypothetical protein NEPAR04_0691 [Nematocida parisii]KAI5143393.1 hypothetical protein NEPAR07_0613 [Nematocida parisii]KAI5154926.1 hypothetical protein NEPAR06_1392 [Nematocida parisii]
MEPFIEEFKRLQRVIYKSTNSYGSTLYYRNVVHVSRLIKKYLKSDSTKKTKELLVGEIQDKCQTAYVSLSSNIALGHNLGLSIGLMAIIAKLYSQSKRLNSQSISNCNSYVIQPIDSSTEEDVISDIFK